MQRGTCLEPSITPGVRTCRMVYHSETNLQSHPYLISSCSDSQHQRITGTQMLKVYCFLSTTTLSPSVTMRSASTVDEAVEAACAGDSHGAQTPVSAISRGRGGRRRHPGPWTAAVLRSALTALSTFCSTVLRTILVPRACNTNRAHAGSRVPLYDHPQARARSSSPRK